MFQSLTCGQEKKESHACAPKTLFKTLLKKRVPPLSVRGLKFSPPKNIACCYFPPAAAVFSFLWTSQDHICQVYSKLLICNILTQMSDRNRNRNCLCWGKKGVILFLHKKACTLIKDCQLCHTKNAVSSKFLDFDQHQLDKFLEVTIGITTTVFFTFISHSLLPGELSPYFSN